MTAPALGDRMPYTLTAADVAKVDTQYPMPPPFVTPQPRAAVTAGDVLTATVVAVNSDGTVNLQVQLNGSYLYWATDITPH